MAERSRPIVFEYRGEQITVTRNDGHPEGMAWIELRGQTFYLRGFLPGMTRGDVKRLAVRWPEEHPQHTG